MTQATNTPNETKSCAACQASTERFKAINAKMREIANEHGEWVLKCFEAAKADPDLMKGVEASLKAGEEPHASAIMSHPAMLPLHPSAQINRMATALTAELTPDEITHFVATQAAMQVSNRVLHNPLRRLEDLFEALGLV